MTPRSRRGGRESLSGTEPGASSNNNRTAKNETKPAAPPPKTTEVDDDGDFSRAEEDQQQKTKGPQEQQQQEEEEESKERSETVTATATSSLRAGGASERAAAAAATTAAAADEDGKKNDGPTKEAPTQQQQQQQSQSPKPPPPSSTLEGGENQQAARNHPPGSDNNKDEDDDPIQQIRSVLLHRKLLLHRLRQGRAAVKRRLDLMPAATMTSDQEVITFRERLRQATSIARKQPATSTSDKQQQQQQQQQRSSSVSLRRGSSVGKRMNAALSSMGRSSAVPTAAAAAAASSAATTSQKGASTAAAAAATTTTIAPKRSISGIAGRTSGTAPGVQHQQARASMKSLQTSATAAARISAQMPAAPPTAATQPLAAAASPIQTALYQHQQQQQQYSKRPAVVCPEAVVLRERRTAVIEKLVALYETRRRRRQQQQQEQKQRRSSSLSGTAAAAAAAATQDTAAAVAATGSKSTTQTTMAPMTQRRFRSSRFLEPPPQQPLPRRRKTHWNYLLEEMRWLATDFQQERHWKAATGRLLGQTVVEEVAVSSLAKKSSSTSKKSKGEETTTTRLPPKVDSRSRKGPAVSLERGDSDNGTDKSGAAVMVPSVNSHDREYLPLTKEETEQVKEISKCLAANVSEYVTDQLKQQYQQQQQQPEAHEEPSAKSPTTVTSQSGEDTAAVPSDMDKKMIMEQVTKRIQQVLSKLETTKTLTSKSKAIMASGIKLSLDQSKVLDCIEVRWSQSGGAALEGGCSSGKTIVACSLLWRQRDQGPSLILTSGTSLVCMKMINFIAMITLASSISLICLIQIKWKHEIGRFDGLNIVMYRKGMDTKSLGEGDVIVCDCLELPSVEKAGEIFETLVIDCRFPNGFEGSRPPTGSLPKKPNRAEAYATNEWWSSLTKIAKSIPRRVVLDNASENELPAYLTGFPAKLCLEILAWRMTFLVGVAASAPILSPCRAILSWARRKVLESKNENESLPEAVRKYLLACTQPLQFVLEAKHQLDDSLLEHVTFDVQHCDMPSEQSDEYARCCSQVQPSLMPRTRERSDKWDDFADALLRLRRHCVHSELQGLASGDISWCGADRLVLGAGHFDEIQIPRLGPSQSSKEIADRMRRGSSKLNTLYEFLVKECSIQQLASLDTATATSGKDKGTKGKRRSLCKIAILAGLPEVVALTSLFLRSLGIDHDILLGDASDPKNQTILSSFNTENPPEKPTQIIVGSLASCASTAGGLSIESADAIVCLDEDWSGRGQMLLFSVISRCIKMRETVALEPVRWIRLVAAETCESSLLEGKKSSSKASTTRISTLNELSMHLTRSGFYDVISGWSTEQGRRIRELWSKIEPGVAHFAFPGCNIFALRDEPLSAVLGTKMAPLLLTQPKDSLFLPSVNDDGQSKEDFDLLTHLVIAEKMASRPAIRDSFMVSPSTSSIICFDHSINAYLDRLASVSGSKNLMIASQIPNRSNNLSTLLSHGSTLAIGTSMTEEDGAHHSIKALNPKVAATSALFYQIPEGKPPGSADVADARNQNRCNLYAFSYGFSGPVNGPLDGCQGSEALVYTPPLFPRVLESSRLAKSDAELLRSRAVADAMADAIAIDESNKRSAEDDLVPPSPAKRQRQEGAVDDVADVEVPHGSPSVPKQEGGETEAVTTEEKDAVNDLTAVLDLSEDYGMAGIGAVPLPRDSALAAANICVDLTTQQGATRERTCDMEEVERAKDATYPLRSMILVVSRKRPRGYSGRPSISGSQMGRAAQGRPLANMPWLTSAAPSLTSALSNGPNGIAYDMNGSGSGKRPRKKMVQQGDRLAVPSSAFTRLPGVESTSITRPAGHSHAASHATKGKDLHKKSLLSSLRQSGLGSTLFEASAFRMASVKVKERVARRLIRHCWTSSTRFEVGPGLPLLVAKSHSGSSRGRVRFEVDDNHWTSIVKRPPSETSTTGSEALEISVLQRAAFHASLASPCRVDFGPFQSGFLSGPSGTTSVAPPRTRVGVSLPMGVKISSSHIKDHSMHEWSAQEDEQLQQSLLKFGMNWILVARSMQGFQEFQLVSGPGGEHGASRICRERWHTLVRKDTTTAKEMRKHEQENRSIFIQKSPIYSESEEGCERSSGYLFGMADEEPKTGEEMLRESSLNVALLPATVTKALPKDDSADTVDANKAKTQRRSFTAFRQAKEKLASVPLNIPGVKSGEAPTIVASHTSHMESVQAAVAASSLKIRSEMWPLQLLAAKRQREQASTTTNAGSPSSSPNHRHGGGGGGAAMLPSSNSARSSSTVVARSNGRAADGSPARPSPARTSHNLHATSSATAQSFMPPPNVNPPPSKNESGQPPPK